MPKFRRRLITAGLAVAVTGTLGVASAVGALAGQIPDQPSAATESAVPGARHTPPARLPWGARPTPIRTGRPGATSDQLRRSGNAAAPDASGATQPRGRYAPKGRTGPSPLRSEVTTVAPSGAAAAAGAAPAPQPASLAGKSTANYFYNVGTQVGTADGFYANVSVAKPTVGTADYHSLAEMAMQSADGTQIVEVGWTVDRVLNGDNEPHLFVYHWVNGATTCYNGCGWVQVSKSAKPGDTLAVGGKKFGIQYAGGAWWVAYDTEFIGYFPASLWSSAGTNFTRAGLVQAFGEVASSTTKPCAQMGNGLPGTDKSAAVLGSIVYLDGPEVELNVRSTSTYYTANKLSSRTFQYGGPGAC